MKEIELIEKRGKREKRFLREDGTTIVKDTVMIFIIKRMVNMKRLIIH